MKILGNSALEFLNQQRMHLTALKLGVESSYKKYVLTIFIDIEAAFDTVTSRDCPERNNVYL